MSTKYCTGCKTTYSTNFYPKNKRLADGLSHYCKACAKVYADRHRLKIKAKREAEKNKLCPPGHKICSTCSVAKPVSEFYANRAYSTGLYGSCIPCYKSRLKYPKSSELEILYKAGDLLCERWTPVIINGVLFPYEISDCGRVKINKSKKLAKTSFDQRGYPQIVLTFGKKRVGRRLHILVAEAYVGNPENLREVNHEDGNKLYPHFSNLKYVTSLQNVEHAIKTGLRTPYYAKKQA